MVGCDKRKCPLLAEQPDETLTEQTNFVLKNANTRNRNISTLQLQWNQFPSLRACGVVETQGTVADTTYILPKHLRRKIPKQGENYSIR